MSLLAALFGAAIGGVVTARSTAQLQEGMFREQRENEVRKLRVEDYQNLIDSADRAQSRNEELVDCELSASRRVEVERIDPTNSTAPPVPRAAGIPCFEESVAAREAARDVSKAVDKISTYGSSGALALAQRIRSSLPDHQYSLRRSPSAKKVSGEKYPDLRNEFQKQMCRDVNPLPRSDC
ncbi:hypothetical protein FXN61_00335 [Lentzea sp. PSKA42]|uniref:Uncharacterized protein n=1 Tax=Lentzea indica TaxID=2604800 RepID=A0ABX1F978_9PSEU|nr:hypothetical protein [Lentzea indica]NKE55354.1 hypothetical protein [Lentzea indica]